MKKLLFIVGSQRHNSFNYQLANQTKELLAGKAEVSILDYSKVPVFNQDLETPVLSSVQAVRDEVLAADGIWIFSPVYNFSIPGPLKNLLDWLSRALDLSDTTGASALNNKLVTVSSVANGGYDKVFESFKELLPFIRMQVVGDFTGTRVNDEAWADNKLVVSDETKASLLKQAAALLAAIDEKSAK
ncbi:hypothetical protein FC40_GL000350 [Ligilactobacillus hayakitensis DSM 18933 = JCM 14209]|uniref:NADPH-dependent FMN reductase-like domain-containing protein n=1 Tax=Ligilactobacillus hayakitensis DSM 18933 = JCM 14209 TaxID=1423755 RepID=A0A0R1WSX1_9LACO|nr:NADPH-dependent FMN reductase [Ligilactobacillus hayakitensis]KRM19268.1 hypothetical protein FC40_GL000350 [Ligilactobacillus hayakitensis DSM 18933 = JCM 14209]